MALLSALYLARAPILTATAAFLTVADSIERADVIFVLAGEANVRPDKAAQLYAGGWAPIVVIPRPEDYESHPLAPLPNVTDVATALLERLGVPRSDIVVLTAPGGSSSTIEDALMFRGYAEQHAVRRVLVVTSMFHTRRTRWIMRRALDGLPVQLIMVPAADRRFDETNWWRTEAGMLAYFQEYVKWLHNRTQW